MIYLGYTVWDLFPYLCRRSSSSICGRRAVTVFERFCLRDQFIGLNFCPPCTFVLGGNRKHPQKIKSNFCWFVTLVNISMNNLMTLKLDPKSHFSIHLRLHYFSCLISVYFPLLIWALWWQYVQTHTHIHIDEYEMILYMCVCWDCLACTQNRLSVLWLF